MRLLTRSDFDGLVCAALLYEAEVITDIKFVHPKDVQDGKIEVGPDDVLANVPYAPGVGLWFDHHASEDDRLNLKDGMKYEGQSTKAPSCARVIFDYYGGAEKFKGMVANGLMEAVDKCDSGQFDRSDILDPKGWVLLSFIMDPRTGLGRYKDYRISNYQLMEKLAHKCRQESVEAILGDADVKERIDRYFEQEAEYEGMLKQYTQTDKNVLVIDLHDCSEIVTGNRFKEYVVYPNQNISIRIIWGFQKQNMVMTVGHSVFNRTSKTDVGKLMLKYGGGGHPYVGTCQVPTEDWERIRDEIITQLKADG
ncbi:MAG: exopolyphosphatase [bacterium]|nr:exopolyphosphatase [bacterium]